MKDAIIIGARCAGSPLAMLLARKGWSVLLVDKNTFPSDTMSTHFIHPTGIARLKRWGLLDAVIASNCPRVDRWNFDMGHATFAGTPPPIDGVSYSYCPRRTVLDEILVRAAERAGAEVREGFTVREIVTEGGRVTGVRGESRGGESATEHARIVIGADGRRSLLAGAVGAPLYEERPVACCCFYTYWDGVPMDGVDIVLREGRAIFAFPTNDGQICTVLEWPRAEFDAVRADAEGSAFRSFDLSPPLAAKMRRARRARHFVGTAEMPNYFRKAYGPGWALAGDAGHHRDPCGAWGISDAFRDADYLAEAVDAGLSGRRPVEEALADYERRRDRDAMPAYRENYALAQLDAPPPPVRALHAALAADQVEADRFTGAILGTVPIEEFFSAANIEGIIGRHTGGRNASAVAASS
jgi:flavin-dependent dehydrogenase